MIIDMPSTRRSPRIPSVRVRGTIAKSNKRMALMGRLPKLVKSLVISSLTFVMTL